jgi:hypothetical protein
MKRKRKKKNRNVAERENICVCAKKVTGSKSNDNLKTTQVCWNRWQKEEKEERSWRRSGKRGE